MKSRRQFLYSGLTTALAVHSKDLMAATPYYMPEEGAPHSRTWMAYGAQRSIWGRRLLNPVRENLVLIANTIAEFEPVTMLVRPEERKDLQKEVSEAVTLLEVALDDLWIRDTGPTFVLSEAGDKAAVDFNFNGWGNKQAHRQDQRVAAFVAEKAGVPRISTDLVLEGGCIEVDGGGTAIITESCVLNQNRNPGVNKAAFEEEFMPLLGLEKIIWLPGVRGKDITDGHTDFYARFLEPGKVVAGYEPDPSYEDHAVTKEHIKILKEATDWEGRRLDVEVLSAPGWVRPKFESNDFAAGYIGYYVCNGAVIMQEFGDEAADEKASSTLRNLFPNREVIALNVDALTAGGGTIHCATQQEPSIT